MEVQGVSPALLKAVEDASIIDGKVDASGNLVLTTKAGQQKNAGSVVKPLFGWPVGSIYIGVTSTNPADLFGGGTWERFGQGRVLVGQDPTVAEFDTALETGGEKTHTLTTAEMPSHNHAASSGNDSPDHSHGYYREAFTNIAYAAGGSGALVASGSSYLPNTEGASTRHTHPITVNAAGGGGAHNNMQPYIVVYMWRRTA